MDKDFLKNYKKQQMPGSAPLVGSIMGVGCAFAVLKLAVFGAIVYVIWHFVAKAW